MNNEERVAQLMAQLEASVAHRKAKERPAAAESRTPALTPQVIGPMDRGVVTSWIHNAVCVLEPAELAAVREAWAAAGIEHVAHDPHRARALLREVLGW